MRDSDMPLLHHWYKYATLGIRLGMPQTAALSIISYSMQNRAYVPKNCCMLGRRYSFNAIYYSMLLGYCANQEQLVTPTLMP